MLWFGKKSKNNTTAIRHAGGVTYVARVVQPANQKPRVLLAEKVKLDLSKPEDAKKLVKDYQLNKTNVTYLLEQHDHSHIQIDRPNVEADELNNAARWALQDLVNFPVEDITIDTIDIPIEYSLDTENKLIYVFYAPNARIAEISNQLVDAKANLTTIEARIMAQRNIANLLEQPDQGVALLSFSSAGVLITFTYQGEVCNARFIEMEVEKTDTFFEKIALEIQRSLDGFEAKFRKIFIKHLYVAPFSLRAQLCEHLSESVYVDVVPFELSSLFDFEDGVELDDLSMQGSIFPLLGAAIRNEATV